MMDQALFIIGIFIFFARIADVSLGTMRTIATVQGQMATAFALGIFEIVIWITVVATVVTKITESPALIVFYALGFATGNVIGILLERKIALGPIILKTIVEDYKKEKMMAVFKDLSLDVTIFSGMGARGPVTELFTVCRRRDLKKIIPRLREIDRNLFYITEQTRDVSRHLKPANIPLAGAKKHADGYIRPVFPPLTGWRAALKKK